MKAGEHVTVELTLSCPFCGVNQGVRTSSRAVIVKTRRGRLEFENADEESAYNLFLSEYLLGLNHIASGKCCVREAPQIYRELFREGVAIAR